MATLKNKQDDDHLKALREIAAIGCNRNCFDCSQRGPTYVNMTVGSFVCTSCSGRLRGLTPPHRVKSISMATFTSEEIDFLKSRGNDFCRKVWLGKRDSPIQSQLNVADESLLTEDLIQKYEKKRWYVAPTDDMYDEARRLNTSCPVKKNEATILSQAYQMTASRSIPNISTQSIQRPTPGNVRPVSGVPHLNPTSSLPQSPVKFSPQTPKSTVAPPVWGVQESPNVFSTTGMANFANFASFESVAQQQSPVISSTTPGFGVSSPPFAAAAVSLPHKAFQSPGTGYKPPVPSDRYAALAELDSTRGTAFPGVYNWDVNADVGTKTKDGTWLSGEQYLSSIYHQYVPSRDELAAPQRLSASLATNPFMAPNTISSSVFSQPGVTSSNHFVSANPVSVATYPPGVYAPYGGGVVQAQPDVSSGAAWSGSELFRPYSGQQLSGSSTSAANPFLNMTRQNVTNPFL